MIYGIYNFFLTLFLILGLPFALPVLLLGKRVREGFLERVGFYPRGLRETLKGSQPIWIHAVSVGEVRAAASLTTEIKKRFPDRRILLSTFTRTGYAMARQMEATADGVVLFPMDHPLVVRRALSLFDPSLLIFLETEIWPNFLHLAHSRGIPTLLLSGRISPRAFRRYRFFGWFFSKVLKQVTTFGMQNQDNAERIIHLGVDPAKVMVTGNLKHAYWGAMEGGGTGEGNVDLDGNKARRVLVAGSTHRGEEEVLLDVFSNLKSQNPDLMMILAPRHPQRFDEVEKLMQKKSVNYQKKSQMNGHGAVEADVVFLDTLGDLPAIYRLASVVFVGGSLVDAGGHNLIEPARWSKPILFGPYMTNFSDLADEMKQKGGGVEVRGQEDLIREISMLLADPDKALKIGERARKVVDGDRGVVDCSMGLVSRYL